MSSYTQEKKLNSRTRIYWLDSIRCISFMMVIYSHVEYCDDKIMDFFSPVFLSTFFFVSGYLSKDNIKFNKFLEQRTRTLYLPFIIWGFLLLCKRYIFTLKSSLPPFGDSIISFLLQDGTDNFLWFIPALYVYSIIFYWIEKFFNKDRYLLFSLTIFLIINWFYIYIIKGPILPYHLEGAGYACLLMGLGKIYSRNREKCAPYFNSFNALFCLIIYIIVCSCSNRLSYNGSLIMVNWIIVTITGLFLMIYISKLRLCRNKLFLTIGANTLICFIIHGQIYAILEFLIIRLQFDIIIQSHPLIFITTGFIEAIITTFILIIPIWIINKFLPFTLGKGYRLWS